MASALTPDGVLINGVRANENMIKFGARRSINDEGVVEQTNTKIKLKADRPHTRNYLTDYRHTDKQLRLVMVLIALYGRTLPSTLSPSLCGR